jgi:hypothetical protein
MSVVYSEYDCSLIWPLFKQATKDRSADNYCSMITTQFKNIEKHYGRDLAISQSWGMIVVYLYKFSKYTHYFLETGLRDFFRSSVKSLAMDYYKPESIKVAGSPEKNIPFIRDFEEDKSHWETGFFIHFPLNERPKSIFVCVGINGFSFFATDGFEMIWNPSKWEGEVNHNDVKFHYENKNEINDLTKIIFGFTLYLDAFPDVIREADSVRHIGHYKGNRHYIRANDVVRTEAHHSVSPHFRRGHFRVLRSDKFKAARGKTIFINGVFVKGKAFDVLADDK